MKSLPLKIIGTECSIVLWFFVSLEMVLNGTLGCFYYYQSVKCSKPISPQKVLVYSLKDYPSMPGGIPQVWWSTIFFLVFVWFVKVHESDQCTMGPVFSVFLFSFLVAQQRQGLSGAHVSRHPLVGRYGVGVCVRHLLCQW